MINFFYIILFYLSFNILKANNSIDIINFNIHGFGKFIGGCKIKENINAIIDEINIYDIIFIQENWRYNNLFREKLRNHQLVMGHNKKKYSSFSSGLLIAINNDIDIISDNEIIFDNCNGIIANGSDCLVSKGFVFTKIKLNNNIFDLYNIHLEAGNSLNDYSVRLNQLETFERYIVKHSNLSNMIICGDFNIDYHTSNEIKIFQNNLNLNVLNWSDDYFLENKIDYIFYRLNPSYKVLEKDMSKILYTLSDHPPLSANIQFK